MAENARIDDLKRKMVAEPGSRLFAQLAEELRKAGQLPEAIQVARDGLERHNNYPSARITLGRALQDSGQLAEARSEYEVVLRSAPDNILAGRLLAECLEGLGDLPGALSRYRTTLVLAPGDKGILGRLAEIEARAATPVVAAVEAEDNVAPRPVESELPPIPLVAVDDEPFEIERSYEAPFTPVSPAEPPGEDRSAAPGSPIGVERTTEFEFELDQVAVPSAEPKTIPWRGVQEARSGAEAASGDDLVSATLGELYYSQGLIANAIDVYRRLLAREPSNQRAKDRLAELERIALEAPRRPSDAPGGTPAGRNRAIERAISRLGSFLVAVKSSKGG